MSAWRSRLGARLSRERCLVQHGTYAGYGLTGGRTLSAEEKPRLIERLLTSLRLERPVLVSPSMSGAYSIPFMMRQPSRLSAFVPVAPVGAAEFGDDEYAKNTVGLR